MEIRSILMFTNNEMYLPSLRTTYLLWKLTKSYYFLEMVLHCPYLTLSLDNHYGTYLHVF